MRITMIAFAVGITLVALSLGSQIRPALADSPPKLNAGPSCDAAVRGAVPALLGNKLELLDRPVKQSDDS
jgi:hypothetical protein